MPKHTVTLPPEDWPADVRDRFERHPLSAAQRIRLGRALGRWLKVSRDLKVEAREVTRQTWLARTEGLPRRQRNEVRQALAVVFPETAAALYAGDAARTPREETRDGLRATIARNLARLPEDWRAAGEPLLQVGEDGFDDGLLVQAWAPSTLRRRLEAAAMFFDFCRQSGLEPDVTPEALRAKLRVDQARVQGGDRRPGGVAVDLDSLTGLATALWPNRNWFWLKATRDRLKKLARHHCSRNAARAVDAAELRAAGQQLLDRADAAHHAARHRRELVKAHTRARTALTMILLAEAPVRIKSCAELELGDGLLADLSGLYLEAARTKEARADRRAFSATLVDAVTRYIQLHRAVLAAPGETRLLVGERGGPVKPAQLNTCLGAFTEPVFKVRVTPHAIRHSVANFIVATAPEEAALATVILNHRSATVTATYQQRADQIIASRRLGQATDAAAQALGAKTGTVTDRKRRPVRRPRTRR